MVNSRKSVRAGPMSMVFSSGEVEEESRVLLRRTLSRAWVPQAF
jgi:hypothetical protein